LWKTEKSIVSYSVSIKIISQKTSIQAFFLRMNKIDRHKERMITIKKDGVYSLVATIGFLPNDTTVDYRARVEIRVNGTAVIAIDNDFFGGNTIFVNVVSVSTIYNLEKGDRVEVFAESNVDGTIVTTENVSHFEAARFPSPSE